MPDAFLDKLRDEFGFDPPREHGYDTVKTIRAMRDGEIGVFIAWGVTSSRPLRTLQS